MGLLETLSEQMEDKVVNELAIKTGFEEQDEIDVSELEMYQAFCDSKTTFNVGFAAITPEGDYYVSVGENSCLVIIMKKEDASRWEHSEIERNKRANLLGIDIGVRVKSIDTENKIIYVEAIKDNRNIRREQIAAELEEYFAAATMNKSEMSVPVNCVVVGVYDYYVVADIAKAGVMARISLGNWANYYIRDIHAIVRRGDVIKVNITGKARMRTISGVQAWEAEHRSYTLDPWSKVDTKRVGKDSVIVAECTGAEPSFNRFWGRPVDNSVLPNNLELLGDMKSGDDAVRPEEGKFYKCTVVRIIPERRILRVRAYQELLEDRNKFGVSVRTDDKE